MSFDVLEGQGPWLVRAQATDVSPSGIQLERPSAPPYQLDSIIPMLLQVPGRGDPLPVSAVLVWVEGQRAGFEFVAVNDADRLEIAELVDRIGVDTARSARRLAAMAQLCAPLNDDPGED